jgi:hypothetical protein
MSSPHENYLGQENYCFIYTCVLKLIKLRINQAHDLSVRARHGQVSWSRKRAMFMLFISRTLAAGFV